MKRSLITSWNFIPKSILKFPDGEFGLNFYIIIKSLLHILLIGILLNGCKREKFIVENGYIPANENFAVVNPLGINRNYIDFEKDSLSFSATFNQEVSWSLIVTGKRSGASIRFDGVSKEITPDKVYWKGTSNDITFFDQGEVFSAKLTFLGSAVQEEVIDSIKKVKKFEGVLISDFETWSDPKVSNSAFWNSSDVGEDYLLGFEGDVVKPIQGSRYYSLAGTDYNNNYYVAILGHNAVPFGLSGSPDENYFNIYLNSNGQTTTQVSMEFIEGDGDTWAFPITINWSGWQLNSIKLSQFALALKTATSDGKLDVNKILAVQFTLLTGDAPGPANKKEVHMDYVVFTKYHPFNPKK